MPLSRRLSTLLFAGCVFASSIAQAETRLFVDDKGIASQENITRHVQQPTKLDKPLISGDRPWQLNPYMYGTVIYDEQQGIFKAWYQSYTSGLPVGIRTPVLYALSKDGRRWTYPDIGNVEFEGSRDNNILFLGLGVKDLYSPSVIKDIDEPDPAKRYKMIYWDSVSPDYYRDPDGRGGGGMFTAVSPDGINWTRSKHAILPARKAERGISDVMDLIRDPATGKYVVYAKGWAVPWPDHRQVVRSESEDFVSWSEPEVVIRHQRDATDLESYGMPVFEYEGMYFGLMRRYHSSSNYTIDIQLMASRDNQAWSFVDREQVFIPVGNDGAWDDGMIFTAPPIVHGDEILIYYGGWSGPHDTRDRDAGIGLATLPVGRLVALQADGKRGELTTTAFTFDGASIRLNADANSGQIRVAVLDESEQVIEGFGIDHALPVRGDQLRAELSWDGSDAASLAGRKISLRFELRGDAKLFAYELVATTDK